MLLLGLLIVGVCFILILATLLKRLILNRNEWFLFSAIFIIGLAMIAYGIVPPEEWDLARHYELIENMEYGGWRYITNESIYTHLPITNILFAIVATTGVYHLLPCIVVCICYSILTYILYKTSLMVKIDSSFIAYAIIFNFAFCPFLHMVSGIRNILAYAMCAWAFYLDFFQHKNRIIVWILYGATIFVHPSAIIICGIRILMPVLFRWKWTNFILVLWSLMVDVLIAVLLRIPVPFLQSIGWKLKDYMINQVFSGYKILFVKIIFLLTILLVLEYYKYSEECKKENCFYKYVCLFEKIVLFIIGAFRVVFIADRMCYFIAFAVIPILAYLHQWKASKIKYIFYIENICVCMLLFVHQFVYFSKDLIK